MRQRVDGILIQDKRILLIQDFSADHRYLPGGGVEAGETHDQALIRERQEECNATIIIGEQVTAYENNNIVHEYQQHTTTYRISLQSSLTLSDELRGIKRFSIQEIKSGRYDFPSAFLDHILPLLS